MTLTTVAGCGRRGAFPRDTVQGTDVPPRFSTQTVWAGTHVKARHLRACDRDDTAEREQIVALMRDGPFRPAEPRAAEHSC
jgi:hypothetical protein